MAHEERHGDFAEGERTRPAPAGERDFAEGIEHEHHGHRRDFAEGSEEALPGAERDFGEGVEEPSHGPGRDRAEDD
jgi:hypothetical protein